MFALVETGKIKYLVMGTLTLMEQKFDFAYEAVCAMQCYTEIMLSNKEELVLQKAVTMLLDNKKIKIK